MRWRNEIIANEPWALDLVHAERNRRYAEIREPAIEWLGGGDLAYYGNAYIWQQSAPEDDSD
jgi:hypothetical protein